MADDPIEDGEWDSLDDELHDVLAPSRSGAGRTPELACGESLQEPIHIGAFHIEQKVGRGGMASVYRGEHSQTGAPVAVKVIQRSAGAEARRRFHREVQAHAGLRHPGIVRLLDYGEIGSQAASASRGILCEGHPYVTMEMAERGTLRDGLPPDDWPTVRSLLVELLEALAHAHARGVVHRDLKPENLLRFDGDARRLKLTDFGIAHAFASEDDRKPAALASRVGTPLYMSPEQFRGDWRHFGPWTDLYGVGCIAWEMVCGRAPFSSDRRDVDQLAERHGQAARPPLQPLFDVPGELEEWIRRCMAIEPEERFQRAADALWHLPERPSEEAQAAERTPRPPVPDDWSRDEDAVDVEPLVGAELGLFGLRQPPFVGRVDERDQIWSSLQRVTESKDYRCMLVVGEAGTGKTRLVDWMATRAHELGAVETLRAVHSPEGGPNEGLRGAIERALRTVNMERSAMFGHLVETLPPLEDVDDPKMRDARALTEYLRPAGSLSEDVEGPTFQFAGADQKYALLVRLLRRLATRRRLLLHLDDLQWGSEALGLLKYLQESVDRHPPMLVLGTVRSDVLAGQNRVQQRLESLIDTARVERVALDPLSGDSQRELLGGLLPLDEELETALVERTEGHPLFAMQLLGHWLERGSLVVDPDGMRRIGPDEISVPSDIHTLWCERIDRMLAEIGRGARKQVLRALELAAALGPDVVSREWWAIREHVGVERPLDVVGRLVDRGLAQRESNGWSYGHGLLADSLEKRARAAGRWVGHHRRCAELLDELYPDRPRETAHRRAEHYIQGEAWEAALAPLFEEFKRLRELGDMADGEAVLERRGDILDRLGVAPDDPRRLVNEVWRIRARLVLGMSIEEAIEQLKAVRRRATSCDSARVGAVVHKSLSWAKERAGDVREAVEAARRSVEFARESERAAMQARALIRLGWARYFEGSIEAAHDCFVEARRHALGTEERTLQLDARLNVAWLALARGDDERAKTVYDAVLEQAEEHGCSGVSLRAWNGLGEVAQYQGEPAVSRDCFLEYLRRVEELNRPTGVATARLNLAQVELLARRFGVADEYLSELEERQSELAWTRQLDHILKFSRLAHATGVDDRQTAGEILAEYDEGFPEDTVLVRDLPWICELAAELAADAGNRVHARGARDLAARLWRRMGHVEKAESLQSD